MIVERALTLIQPMGWAIVHKHKHYENRSKNILPVAMRGKRTRVAIHNGAKWDDRYARMVRDLTGQTPAKTKMGIIGVATFTGRVYTLLDPPPRDGREPWFFGPFGFELDLAESVAFDDLIECQGMLGFWKLQEQLQERIAKELAP